MPSGEDWKCRGLNVSDSAALLRAAEAAMSAS